jgi:RNA polymerase sigma-70 factor (ECF subfamily)
MASSEPAQKAFLAQTDEIDERRLVEAAQRDLSHFAEIYDRYFDFIYAYVTRRTNNRAAAEDITSEVFRKALVNLPRFKWTGAPFGAWLVRIAFNLIADRAKRSAREGGAPIQEDREPAAINSATGGENQQAMLEQSERRARLFQLVDELAEDQRRVVVMRFAEEKSIKQIAGDLGRSEGAVKQLQFRALENLRKMLSAETEVL